MSVGVSRNRLKDTALSEMVLVPGGIYQIDLDPRYDGENIAQSVSVDAFLMDSTPVTNRQFAEFVRQTAHVTVAERHFDLKDYPCLPSSMRPAESPVYVQPIASNAFGDLREREIVWSGDWCHPYGPDSNLNGLDNHPVVHVAFADASAFARWIGKDLPTEAEWEFAARGGLDAMEAAWPNSDFNEDGHERTLPVTAHAPNAYGLYDMIGSIWEWTSDQCLKARQTAGQRARRRASGIPREDPEGGWHSSAPHCCHRPAEAIDASTIRVGFRCVIRRRRSI